MLLITCPVCGYEGDEREFLSGTIAAPDEGADGEEARRRPQEALRFCALGCGRWFRCVRRDSGASDTPRTDTS